MRAKNSNFGFIWREKVSTYRSQIESLPRVTRSPLQNSQNTGQFSCIQPQFFSRLVCTALSLVCIIEVQCRNFIFLSVSQTSWPDRQHMSTSLSLSPTVGSGLKSYRLFPTAVAQHGVKFVCFVSVSCISLISDFESVKLSSRISKTGLLPRLVPISLKLELCATLLQRVGFKTTFVWSIFMFTAFRESILLPSSCVYHCTDRPLLSIHRSFKINGYGCVITWSRLRAWVVH